jgi:hypothetical protein
LTCAALALAPRAFAAGGPVSREESQLIEGRLIPRPRLVQVTDGPAVRLDERLAVSVTLRSEAEGLAKRVKGLFSAYFGAAPEVAVKADASLSLPPEGYRVRASAGRLSIEAADASGALNALKTLRQAAEPERGVARLTAYALPELAIEDAPALAFRGLHLCWFPENDEASIEKSIRLAAYYKYNYVVLEPWGVFGYRSHPEFAWAEKRVKPKVFTRLARVAREQGVTLIPQLNLFGHASGSRHISGKHVALDFRPELQPLFEPDGWTWCLGNPATRTLLTELSLELYEAFERPPYFHIGCDEAYSMATCATCRKADYAALFKEHLLYFHSLFRGRGASVMMWHDMLVASGDPRWKGYYANGRAWADGLLDALPKDIVICDWYYGAPKKEETWSTVRYFRDKGFPVLTCPWKDAEGIKRQSRLAREERLAGVLGTTWNYMYGQDMYRMLCVGASAAWGCEGDGGWMLSAFNQHLRQVGWDMRVTGYRDTGSAHWQVPPENAMGQ